MFENSFIKFWAEVVFEKRFQQFTLSKQLKLLARIRINITFDITSHNAKCHSDIFYREYEMLFFGSCTS